MFPPSGNGAEYEQDFRSTPELEDDRFLLLTSAFLSQATNETFIAF